MKDFELPRRWLLRLLCFSLLAGPGAGLACPAAGSPTSSSGDLVFPQPPERSRIRYLQSIYDNAAYAPRKKWWRRLVRKLAGTNETTRIVRPYGLESSAGSLFVCDPGAGFVHGFLAEDSSYVRIPRKERLPSPIDVAVDSPKGRVYVTDSKLGVVNCYDIKGGFRYEVEGDFLRPTGIAFHGKLQQLYVVDTMAQRVFIHAADGRRKGSFGERGAGPGEFNYPTSIFVGSDHNVYVTDAMNFRVQVFDPEGEFIRMFGRLGDGTGDFSKPKGVAVDSDGNIYVVDAIFDAVQIFDTGGRLLLSFGASGKKPGEFWMPTGITVDDRDRVYVSDSYNSRIQVFQYLKE